jgi:hypothetical protein
MGEPVGSKKKLTSWSNYFSRKAGRSISNHEVCVGAQTQRHQQVKASQEKRGMKCLLPLGLDAD